MEEILPFGWQGYYGNSGRSQGAAVLVYRALGPTLHLRDPSRGPETRTLALLGANKAAHSLSHSLITPTLLGSLAFKKMQFRLWSQRGLGWKGINAWHSSALPTLLPTCSQVYQTQDIHKAKTPIMSPPPEYNTNALSALGTQAIPRGSSSLKHTALTQSHSYSCSSPTSHSLPTPAAQHRREPRDRFGRLHVGRETGPIFIQVPLTSTSTATSAASVPSVAVSTAPRAILLLLIDFFGLGHLDLTLASTDSMELFLQNLLHRFFFFKGDKHKTSSFVQLWIHWKFNGLNLPKLAKVLPDLFLSGFRIQTPNEDFLHWVLLHSHGLFRVNDTAIQPVLLLV